MIVLVLNHRKMDINSDKELAMRAGATRVLVKPITLNVLRDC